MNNHFQVSLRGLHFLLNHSKTMNVCPADDVNKQFTKIIYLEVEHFIELVQDTIYYYQAVRNLVM